MAEPLKIIDAMPITSLRDPKDVEENKDLAALSYAWVMSVVLLMSKKQSPFVPFHAKQGTVLFVLSMLFWVLPYANRVLELIVFFLMVWGFLAAAQGHWTDLPFIGPLARGKFTFRGSWKQTVAAIVSAKNWVLDLWTHHDPAEAGRANGQGPGAQDGTNHQQSSNPPKQEDIPPVDPTQKF